jgi:hypothetical protein
MLKYDLPDIDLDVFDKNTALNGLTYIRASVLQDKELRKHPTGVFFQDIPVDPVTKLAVFPSGEKAGHLSDEMGFYKIDLIPNSAYEHVRNRAHLEDLIKRETNWSKLCLKENVEKLQHINNYPDIIDAYGPDNVPDLACLISLIRPGKKHLIGETWDIVRKEVWKKDTDQYVFKKSHAIAFSLMITVQFKSMEEAGII